MFGIEKDFQNLMEQVYGPLNKDKMTEIDISKVLIEGDTATIMGEKYQKVQEPPTLYNKLETWIEYGNFSQSKDVLANEVLNMVREFIPEPMVCDDEDYDAGWNDAIRKMEGKLK